MSAEVALYIREQVAGKADLTLAELQLGLARQQGVRFSIGRLWGLLRQLDLRLKKSHAVPRNGTRKRTASAGSGTLKKSARLKPNA